ncbi:HEAT repeat domain-containing protein [Halorussus marinus]|uniref:HEAT repeat domain-containing protein n=1 Tax=Halorussus marinus TaxID=2505976 RepID=UPI001091E0B3|nr:HEAT repeat domain-containing protein [Halorussus marinus]
MTEYANRSARAHAPADDEADLRSLLASPREPERRDAALALVDRADEAGIDEATIGALAERVRTDDSTDVRQFAVEALGAGGPAQRAERAIRAALDRDGDKWVRAEAVVALSRVAPDDGASLRAALDDDSGFVRRNAVIALGKTGAGTDETFADRLKNDPHPAVREYAAQFLGRTADDVPEAVRLLAAILAREPEAFVRAKAADALGELGTDRAEQAIETHGLTDRSDDVRRAAETALAAARGVDPDHLDVDVEEPSPPGGGPQSPRETPKGGPSPEPKGPGPSREFEFDR